MTVRRRETDRTKMLLTNAAIHPGFENLLERDNHWLCSRVKVTIK